MWRRPSPS
uniref:Uncharacterized protein n=1 Tax=Anguilla anguilla TaxID=7936 RepID=A0A0E9SGN5_ANGAN